MSEPSRRHRALAEFDPPCSLTLAREIPSRFRFCNEPMIHIVAVLSSSRLVDFVGWLADSFLNLVWRPSCL
jgi:hypothetical protein